MPLTEYHDMVQTFPSNRANHALGIGVLPRRLRDRQAQLQHLAVDSGCSPERIGAAHPPNEIPHFRPNRGSTPSVSTLPCPVAPEALTVPPHHGLGPHHLQRTPPVLPQPRQHDPEEPVRRRQLWARLAHLPHGDLLSECEVLQRQLPLRANRGPQCPNEDRKPSHHIRSIADQSRQPQDNRAGRVFRKDTRPSWYLVADDDRMIPPPAQRLM